MVAPLVGLCIYTTLFFNPGALKLSVSAHPEVLFEKKKERKSSHATEIDTATSPW